MRLAGQMRLTTFLGMAGSGLLVAAIAGFGALGWWWSHRPAPAALPAPVPVPVVAVPVVAPPPPTPVPTSAPVPSRREVDDVLFSYLGRNLGTDKLKDVTKGKPFKVNVYQDSGKPAVNRAKVDLDRDDRWDEKITFDAERITRQVASADDEWYDLTYHWDGSSWVRE